MITVIPCLGVCQFLILVSCYLFKIVLLEFLSMPLRIHTKLLLGINLHFLPIEHCYIFKTAVMEYKFLHSGYPKYFTPFLMPKHGVYGICKSQAGGVFLEV